MIVSSIEKYYTSNNNQKRATKLRFRSQTSFELKDVCRHHSLNPNFSRAIVVFAQRIPFHSLPSFHFGAPFFFIYRMCLRSVCFRCFVCFMHQNRATKGKKRQETQQTTNIELRYLSRISRRDNNNISLRSYYLIFRKPHEE